MSADDWKFELQRLFETFERESTISLRKINRCFEFLGRPFSDEFRRYFLEMSILRLDSSFDAILMERNFDIQMQMQMPSTSNAHTVTNDIEAEVNTLNSTIYNVDCPSMPQNGSLVELKIENCDDHDSPIVIYDSNDEEVGEKEQTQATNDTAKDQVVSNIPPEFMSGIQNSGDERKSIDSVNENGVEDHVKRDLKVEIVDEVMDLPLIVFDPNNVDESLSVSNGGNNVAELPSDDNPPSSSAIATEPPKNEVVKRFKCEHCNYASQYKHCVQKHQKIHTSQTILGIAPDANDGLFECTQCDQQFSRWHSLKSHLTSTHKNNQRLFNCGHCMRRFIRKTEKDGHEANCRVRRYQCFLCKKYGTRELNKLQRHMRTHSGARPFKCAICNKCFGMKHSLKFHLNSIHSLVNA